MSSDLPDPTLPRLIAVIDDDERSRRGLDLILRSLGCRCEMFDSVRSFLASHAIRRVDCIVLDYAMPEIDGVSAHKALKHTNYTGPFVFCSGYDEEELREFGLRDEHIHFLRKPVKKAALRDVLRAAAAAAPRPARAS